MEKPGEVEFTRLLVAGLAIMVALALAVVSFVVVYQKRVQALRLALQQRELDYQTLMIRSVITSQEAERERIAQDLHDEIGASLSTVRLFLNQIKYEASTQFLQELAGQASQIVGDTLKSVRQIVQNMSPLALDKLGFCRAIAQLVNRLATNGLRVESCVAAAADELPAGTQLALYRIIQELFANAMKHAQASCLVLHMQREGAEWLVRISDDGCGFVTDATGSLPGGGMGLAGIAARSKLLGAQLHIESAPGKGTRVGLRIPEEKLLTAS